MAKRAAINEKPFRPLDAAVLRSVLHHTGGEIEVIPHPEPLPPVTKPESPAIQMEVQTHPKPPLRKLDQEKRILFTREETHALDRLVTALASRLSAQVKVSHVIRAATLLLLHGEGEIGRAASERGTLVRPPNGDMAAIQRFERELAKLINSALRDAPPLRDAV